MDYVETLLLYVHQFDSVYLITLSIQTSVHQGRCTNPLPEKAWKYVMSEFWCGSAHLSQKKIYKAYYWAQSYNIFLK